MFLVPSFHYDAALGGGRPFVKYRRQRNVLMSVVLVRYGTIPEVARFESGSVGGLTRGRQVVVETHRGLQLGTYLEQLKPVHPADRDPLLPETGDAALRPVLRVATDKDIDQAGSLSSKSQGEYGEWSQRIADWRLELELIDLEWTLDGEKLILYVLNDRGPDCTKLALQAAAAGLGHVEVQPVDTEGLVTQPTGGGGCGSCGCG